MQHIAKIKLWLAGLERQDTCRHRGMTHSNTHTSLSILQVSLQFWQLPIVACLSGSVSHLLCFAVSICVAGLCLAAETEVAGSHATDLCNTMCCRQVRLSSRCQQVNPPNNTTYWCHSSNHICNPAGRLCHLGPMPEATPCCTFVAACLSAAACS